MLSVASASASLAASSSMFARVSSRRPVDQRLRAVVELGVEAVDLGLGEGAAAPPLALGAAQVHVPAALALLEPVHGLHERLEHAGQLCIPRVSARSRRPRLTVLVVRLGNPIRG